MINCDELAMATGVKDVGVPLSESRAKGFLRTYFQGPNQPASKDEWVFGHLFGIDKLDHFLKTIANYNAAQASDDTKVHGVRIYNGKSQRTDDPYASLGILHDVFLVPVLKNGKDMFPGIGDVHPPAPETVPQEAAAAPYILGESRPCPNQCGSAMLLLTA